MAGQNSHTNINLNSNQQPGFNSFASGNFQNNHVSNNEPKAKKRAINCNVQYVAKKPCLSPKRDVIIKNVLWSPKRLRGRTLLDLTSALNTASKASVKANDNASTRPKTVTRSAKTTHTVKVPLSAVTVLPTSTKTETVRKGVKRKTVTVTVKFTDAVNVPTSAVTILPTSTKKVTSFTPPVISSNVTATNVEKSTLGPIVTAAAPMPPNWLDNCEDTIMSLNQYQTYNISPSSVEYETITKMLHPVQIKQIDRIVNPDLWKRFVNTRKEMLRSKTDDFNLLSKLGLDEPDLIRSNHLLMNYAKDPAIIPYSDNMALLFHCTRNKTNLDNIFSQGLDERLSRNVGNLLGKGIYFADDPRKSLQYDKDGSGSILIFAVLLGDCISVDDFQNKMQLVREPEKIQQQKRNLNDIFFDSIVARPAGYNEYVIYNRYQCYPLYEINYDPILGNEDQSMNNFNLATKKLPPFAWMPEGSKCHMPVQNNHIDYPFFAVALFEKMGASRPIDEEDVGNGECADDLIEANLAKLLSVGFSDVTTNRKILWIFRNNIDEAINYLLDHDSDSDMMVNTNPECNQPLTSAAATPIFINSSTPSSRNVSSTSSAPHTATSSSSVSLYTPNLRTVIDLTGNMPIETEDCLVCYNDYESFATGPQLWKELKCSHILCQSCYSNTETTRTTMSGVQHTFVKCPFCQGISGTEVGTCPDGDMTVKIIQNSCESYEPTTSIRIKYLIDSDYKLKRTAYLPNTVEGQEVLQLLKIAWDRRLCFTIGTSITTRQENVLVWGIHHKTSLNGGVSSYGYPDQGYMGRVKSELKAFGIE